MVFKRPEERTRGGRPDDLARQEVEAHHKKWVTRGGRNLKYWSTLYSKSLKGQASSSSSSGAVWIPNP